MPVYPQPTLAQRADAQPEALGIGPVLRRSLPLLWLVALAVALFGGPLLADHEIIVAQTARQMLDTGDWIVPHYLDTPFLVKPPMPYWFVAVLGRVMHATASGLPITDWEARLPSIVATILTVFVIWRLARSMFGRRAAWIAAFVQATALGSLLYAVNATAEALLTLFCTWAMAEFWRAMRASTSSRRRIHLARFYIALGLGMFAKGPMPMMVTAVPIAAWWWLDRPLRIAAVGGRRALGRFVGDLVPRLILALRRLGLWWGVPVFLLMFVPWMLLAARRIPYAWEWWGFEYVNRLEGRYPGSRFGEFYYYIPILFGLVLPWLLSLPEALMSPFLRVYRPLRRPLTYAWCWVVVSWAILSVMSFKKPYYVLPAVPGCALLLGPVLERFFFGAMRPASRWARLGGVAIVVAVAVGFVVGWFVGRAKYPEQWHGSLIGGSIAGGVLIVCGVAAAVVFYLRGRRGHSLVAVGATGVVVFVVAWVACAPALGTAEAALQLVDRLRQAGVSDDTPLYWAGTRPEGAVLYYGGRSVQNAVDPYRLVVEQGTARSKDDLRLAVAGHIVDLMKAPAPACIVLERGQYGMLVAFMKLPVRELFSIDRGPPGVDDDDWVVATNVGADRR